MTDVVCNLDSVNRFKYVAVLYADIQDQGFSRFSQLLVKGLLVDIGRDIHFVDHDIIAGFIASFEDRLLVGDIYTVAGDGGADTGDEPFAVRPFGCDHKWFAPGLLDFRLFIGNRFDMHVHIHK